MADLRSLSVADILKELNSARAELMEHRIKVSTGQEQTNHKIAVMKIYIAQMHTIMTEKGQEPSKSEKVVPAAPAKKKRATITKR